ncbi:poly(R)-hydroxyalkanoic acid synthase, class III, PhaE subunit [Luteibacter sp. UNC138MFCol5.1]|uniref:poly(R)-hydroxyalkanoic acid synthase subunit PhaE n=1 Tax=Luteibacter sp. UNC138MFCol5.1 TaxID=1502774 RepID=UPI0008B110D4|nr:poly(R)-hydroxyalkanoic acid synthase subunit PhaE [Luteibacter sp. UNC138MFCol5.1]SEO78049.1 poly(R)-hydroxyalkanoic acid synthase, class III, PhaE subunit [Luteibacter sp. UNC138MFCol5.1]
MSDKPHDFIDQYQAWVREGVEAWSRQFDPKASPAEAMPSADIMGRLFAGLGGYGDWMRSYAGGEAPSGPFAGMPSFGQGGPGMPPFGYGPLPGAAPHEQQRFDEWARVANEALSLPAFGLTREQQEEQQALLRAWIDYAGHYQRYQALLQGVHERANAALREQGPPSDADSMRSVYDRWVNLAEESYAEAALSAEFREVYAALVNAQMHLKMLQQRQVERAATQAGMPTRKEVDSLGERLQAVRRELRHMQGLKAEVEALRAQVATLTGTKASKTAKASKASKSAKPSGPAKGRGR